MAIGWRQLFLKKKAFSLLPFWITPLREEVSSALFFGGGIHPPGMPWGPRRVLVRALRDPGGGAREAQDRQRGPGGRWGTDFKARFGLSARVEKEEK